MSIMLINKSGTQKPVPIVNANTKVQDEVMLQPRGKLTLPIGFDVSPQYREPGVERRVLNGINVSKN